MCDQGVRLCTVDVVDIHSMLLLRRYHRHLPQTFSQGTNNHYLRTVTVISRPRLQASTPQTKEDS